MPLEQFLAMVKNTHVKRSKGGGKGGKGARPPRKCYECDAESHIAADCFQSAARVAAGGPERLDDPMGQAGGKAKGKNGKKGKGDKGSGKGGKGGTWTATGDHGGYWIPTRAQIKGSGGFPFPTQHQYSHAWHTEGKGPQPGAKLMTGSGAEEPEDWTTWMRASGYAMSLRQVPAREAVETSNAFAALASEEPDIPDSAGSQDSFMDSYRDSSMDSSRDSLVCADLPEPIAPGPPAESRQIPCIRRLVQMLRTHVEPMSLRFWLGDVCGASCCPAKRRIAIPRQRGQPLAS